MPRSSSGSDERVGLDTPNNYKKLEEENSEQGKMTGIDAWEIILSLTWTFINWKDKTLNNGNYPSCCKFWNTDTIQLKEHYLLSDVLWPSYSRSFLWADNPRISTYGNPLCPVSNDCSFAQLLCGSLWSLQGGLHSPLFCTCPEHLPSNKTPNLLLKMLQRASLSLKDADRHHWELVDDVGTRSQLCLAVPRCRPLQTLLMWQGTVCHTAIVL